LKLNNHTYSIYASKEAYKIFSTSIWDPITTDHRGRWNLQLWVFSPEFPLPARKLISQERMEARWVHLAAEEITKTQMNTLLQEYQ
jgi:hypothetical protein